jgi:hypothetical protein
MKEPMRMCEGDQLPPALRDAFGAMAQEAPSAETLLRVQRALQALPAAAPGAVVGGAVGLGKLLVLAVLIGGTLASAVALNSRRTEPGADQPRRAPLDVSSASAPPSQPLPGNAAIAQVREASEAVAQAEPSQQPGRAAQKRAHTPASARVPVNGLSAAVPAQTAQDDLLAPRRPGSARRSGAVEPVAMSPHDAVSAAAQATSELQPPDATSDPQAAPAPSPTSSAGEAERLARCKRLALRDPAAALREVEALAAEVPHGVFVQERELLAIRLHEQLGHRDQAAELTQRFLERYPRSVYRRAQSP